MTIAHAYADASNVDYFSLHTRQTKSITLDMLDYGYVEKCADIDELKGILALLRSGKEGKYPMLETATEERILAVLPARERSKIERMRSGPSSDDVESEKAMLTSWTTQMDTIHHSLQVNKGDNPPRRMPPVRGQIVSVTSQETRPANITSTTSNSHKKAIPAYDFRAWEKYDVDKALSEIEEREEQARKHTRHLKEIEARRGQERKKALASLPSYIDLNALSQPERKVLARLEKEKGNDCFKANENEEAVLYYTRSIAFDDSDAVLYSNRAAAYLRVKNFTQAEDDCSRAIELDPSYCKAWKRRGMTRFRRGKYAEAVEDFQHSLRLEPGSLQLENLLKKTIAKRQEVDGMAKNQSRFEQASQMTPLGLNLSEEYQQTTVTPQSTTLFKTIPDDDKDDACSSAWSSDIQTSKPFQRFEILED